jgi:hypothetical protein
MQLNCFSQQLSCGVQDEEYQKELARIQILQKIKHLEISKGANVISYIPVKLHLFGLDNNTGYVDSNAANNALAELNKQFKPINIEFYFSGTNFNYYPNTLFYNNNQTSTQETDFYNSNAVNNAMNVYVSSVVKSRAPSGNVVGGWAYITPSYQAYNTIWLNSDALNDNKSAPHEFGHYFGLLHTFNKAASTTVSERELVTRKSNEIAPRLSANCSNTGDYVCDTASDPRGNGDATVASCVYSGTVKDANSDAFNPLVSNYMDYNFCNPYSFTAGQFSRMKDGLLIVTNPTNDFTLNAPETPQNAPSKVVATSIGDYSGNVSLSWTDNSAVETGYIIEQSTSLNGPFTAVAGVKANTTTLSNVPTEPNVSNYYRIKASNTKNNYSTISNPIVGSTLCSNNYGQSCDLAANTALAAWRIEDFILTRNSQAIINNTGSGCSQNGIGNYFNSFSPVIAPGQTLNFTVRSKKGTDGAYNIFVKIYADWNNDNDFDDANELVYTSASSLYQVSGSFIVPNIISVGNIRLRISLSTSSVSPTACGVYFGEIEDYKLVNNTLAINDFNYLENLKIYPNPTSSILTLQTPNNLSLDNITITDLTGKVVLTQTINTTLVNVASLASGMYVIEAVSGNEKWVSKFIKE